MRRNNEFEHWPEMTERGKGEARGDKHFIGC